jgi:hypothetical protein
MQLLVEYLIGPVKEKLVEQLCDGKIGLAPQGGKMPRIEGGH